MIDKQEFGLNDSCEKGSVKKTRGEAGPLDIKARRETRGASCVPDLQPALAPDTTIHQDQHDLVPKFRVALGLDFN